MKLIDLLVKELPKRGGWPVSAISIAQDSEGHAWGYNCEHLTLQPHGLWRSKSGDAICTDGIKINEISSDWDKTFITRAQYESALAASEGWIEWGGGECPVGRSSLVDLKFRNGATEFGYNASAYYWENANLNTDIIAYRLHRDINSRANDDRLEQDLNECIGQDVDPAWNGKGLPPLGVECELQDKNTKQWQPVKVVYTSEWVTVIREINKEKGDDLVEIAIENYGDDARLKLRPLRTEAEKVRESACHEIASMIGRGTFFEDAERIYDAISSGEIKVYSKESK